MMEDPQRTDANKAVLDLFSAHTGLPIGLFEKYGDEYKPTFSTDSLKNFEPHCNLIQQSPEGKEACHNDQCMRAERAFLSRQPQLTCCHAGLWNQSLPIVVDGEVEAVLLFGEMLIDNPAHMQETMNNHRQTVKQLGLSEEEAATLGAALQIVKRQSLDNLQGFLDKLLPIETYLYTMIHREQTMEHEQEKIVHELQTRLTAVMAHAENIATEVTTLKPRLAREMARSLLYSAIAMTVVVNNLGDFRQSYTFKKLKIRPVFIEAWRVYNAEAVERNIKLQINLAPLQGSEPELDVSIRHLELAVNNLMHNAIKYSFNGNANRDRFVKVEGAPEGPYYRISISNYGVGIEQSEIDEGLIFKDGYQGKLTQGENRTGSGKGLSFVKRVIDRHHGIIHVESVKMGSKHEFFGEPHLTTFTIHLPIEHPKEEFPHG